MDNLLKNLPIFMIFAVVARAVIFGAQISDSLIVVALCALYYLLSSLDYNKLNKKFQQDLDALTTDLNKHKAEIADVKQYVSGAKLATSLSGKK